jgi:hypothetical protein
VWVVVGFLAALVPLAALGVWMRRNSRAATDGIFARHRWRRSTTEKSLLE